MAKPTYKPPKRRCAIEGCDKNGVILWAQGMKKDSANVPYICLTCAQRMYPEQFTPPAEKQAKLEVS